MIVDPRIATPKTCQLINSLPPPLRQTWRRSAGSGCNTGLPD